MGLYITIRIKYGLAYMYVMRASKIYVTVRTSANSRRELAIELSTEEAAWTFDTVVGPYVED